MRPSLQPDCASCAGLCCVELPFARSVDFPEAKAAGVRCRHLDLADRCVIHPRLRELGWRGCTVFECYGAGQRVTASFAQGDDSRRGASFRVAVQLHEMLWLLTDPVVGSTSHAGRARELADEVDGAAGEPLGVDVGAVRARAGLLLRAVSDEVRGRAAAAGRAAARLPRQARPGGDLAGARLRGADLRSAPLRGALLIGADLRDADLRGADLLGTDLRDADLRGADLRGADLRESLFVAQPQVNGAAGDDSTTLPARLDRPPHWTALSAPISGGCVVRPQPRA